MAGETCAEHGLPVAMCEACAPRREATVEEMTAHLQATIAQHLAMPQTEWFADPDMGAPLAPFLRNTEETRERLMDAARQTLEGAVTKGILMHRAVRVSDDDIVVEVEHGDVPQVGDELRIVTPEGAVDWAYVRDVRREFTMSRSLTTVTARLERREDAHLQHAPVCVGALEIRRATWPTLAAVVDEPARSTIHADYLLEGSWPTLAEVGRSW